MKGFLSFALEIKFSIIEKNIVKIFLIDVEIIHEKAIIKEFSN
jgi:hypothetical protein